MSILSVSAMAVICTLMAILLKKRSSEMSFLLVSATAVIIMISFINDYGSITDKLRALTASGESEYFLIPLKALGITLIASLTKNLCDDAGEKSISFTVDAVSKGMILITAMPLFDELLGNIKNLMGV